MINMDGTVGDRLPITLDEMRALYADMVETRTYDHKCMAMQRQGRLATYAPFEGQEAAQIGSDALQPDDWGGRHLSRCRPDVAGRLPVAPPDRAPGG